MKLFKRMAAVAMAAMLSLSVLTACGGSGTGTSATRLKKLIEETKQSGEFYIEMRDIKAEYVQKEGINPKYTVVDIESADVSGWIVVENAADIAYKKVFSDFEPEEWSEFGTWGSSTADTYFNESVASILSVDPNYKIEGMGTFYAEYLRASGSKLVYCFESGELKYFVAEYDKSKVVYEVKLGAEIPQELKLVIEDFEAWKNAKN